MCQDDAFRRRLEETSDLLLDPFADMERQLQFGANLVGTCTCPEGVDPDTSQGVAPSDFQVLYGDRINYLQEQGEVESVVSNVDTVIEGKKVKYVAIISRRKIVGLLSKHLSLITTLLFPFFSYFRLYYFKQL